MIEKLKNTPAILFLAILAACAIACQKGLELTEGEPEERFANLSSANSAYFFEAEIGGDSIIYRDLVDTNLANGAQTSFIAEDYCGGVNIAKMESFFFGNATDTGATRIIQISIWGCAPPQLNLDTLVDVQRYGYGSLIDTIPGVLVQYLDDDNKLWQSVDADGKLPQSQRDSTFVITDMVNNTDQFAGRRIAGEFSVVLYDSNGTQINLEGGKFVSRVRGRLF